MRIQNPDSLTIKSFRQTGIAVFLKNMISNKNKPERAHYSDFFPRPFYVVENNPKKSQIVKIFTFF